MRLEIYNYRHIMLLLNFKSQCLGLDTLIYAKNKMKIFIAMILSGLALTGCASIYKPNPDGPTARLRMVSTFPEVLWISALKEDCFRRIEDAATINTLPIAAPWGPKRESIGMPIGELHPEAVYKESIITADRPINIAFFAHGLTGAVAGPVVARHFGGDKYCTTAVQFTPGANKDYEMLFEESGGNCVLSVYEINTGPEKTYEKKLLKGLKRLPHC